MMMTNNDWIMITGILGFNPLFFMADNGNCN